MKGSGKSIDVHKPLQLIRNLDALMLDDGAAATLVADPSQVVAAISSRKRDIPTPIIHEVEGYERDQPRGYKPPDSYIRYTRRANAEEDFSTVEYCLEFEDERWLRVHPKLRAGGSLHGRLDEDTLERMLDILEKMTGTGQMPPIPLAEQRFAVLLGQVKGTHHEVWNDVCAYWRQKRQRLGKPLLRRFWPVTGTNDTDPHKVFRPREKERYKLRKHRRNDMESYRRLQQLRRDFEGLLQLLDMVRRRELIKQAALPLWQEIFEQHLYELTDTSGMPRELKIQPGDFRKHLRASRPLAASGGGTGTGDRFSFSANNANLLAAASYDAAEALRRKKKRARESDGRDDDFYEFAPGGAGPGAADDPQRAHMVEPPSFVEALETRDSFRETVLESIEPNLPAYTSVNGRPAKVQPVFRFRCRARVGRGARVVFDRVAVRQAPDGEEDEEEPPPRRCITVYSGGVSHPFAPPAVHRLQQPPQCLYVDERRIQDIYAMDDENDDHNAVLEAGDGAVEMPRPANLPAIRISVKI